MDTHAVSAIVKSRANALTATLNERPFCISVITEPELRFGLARRAVNADLRRIVEGFLRFADIRPWTSAAAQRYGLLRAELQALGKSLARMDRKRSTVPHGLNRNGTAMQFGEAEGANRSRC
jgi:tRNA(fMet)-specific endonuclease VapC